MSSRSSNTQLLNPQSIPESRPWTSFPQLPPVRVTVTQAGGPSSSPARSPLASPQHTPPVSPFDVSRRSTYRDSDSESVRSDVTIDDAVGTPYTQRLSIRTDNSSPSPVPRAMLSPVLPSPAADSYAPSSYEEDLFFRTRDKTPSPTPSRIRKSPPPALALVPTSSTSRPRSPAPTPSPRQSYGPPCAPPPAVALPEIPKSPSHLQRFSTQSAKRLSSIDPMDSTISLTSHQNASSASDSMNNVVVRRASRLALLSDTLSPIGVAPATYRPTSTVVLIPDSSTPGPISSAGFGSAGATEAGLFQDTFMLSEQSLHQPGSAVASTIAFSESGDDERSRLTDKHKSSLSSKQRPMSWGNPPSVRSTGQRIAASIWQFASGLRSPRTSRTSNAPQPPARAMNIHPDRDLDLEELAQRANDLGDMLAEGRLPNDSIRSVPLAGKRGSHTRSATSISAGGMRSRLGRSAPISGDESRPESARPKPKRRVTIAISSTFRGVASRATPFTDPADKAAEFTALDEGLSPARPRRRRWTTRRLIIVVSIAGVLLVVLLVAVIFGLRRRSPEVALCANSNMTGVLCNLGEPCVSRGHIRLLIFLQMQPAPAPVLTADHSLERSRQSCLR